MNSHVTTSRWRLVGRILWPCALVAVLVAIWVLTVQTPTQTVSLSDVFVRGLVRVSGMSYTRAFRIVRKVVHTFEFFPVGLFLSLTALSWESPTRPVRRWHLIALVIALCFACSLGDQIHKAFVPGREFDLLDMAFDAVGYLLGILVASRLYRPTVGARHLKG